MFKIAVVILHYENLKDTVECLKSLIVQDGMSFDIVVIDNGSKREQLKYIENDFLNNNIYFLYSDVNLGFAKGNNLGFNFAKTKLKSDIIVLGNNDLIFNQTDFIKRVHELYIEKHFDVAGPKIISLVDGMNQNPVKRAFYTKGDVEKRYIKMMILYILNRINLDLLFKKILSKPIKEFKYDGLEDFQLFGACLIFGADYVEKYDGLYSGTFMYAEEDILRYQVEVNCLKMNYLDEIEVQHKEGSSTSAVYKKDRLKRQFYYRWSLNSLGQLMKMMNS